MAALPAKQPESPRWNSTTKMVVGLAIVVVLAGLVVVFRNLIGPLLLAFILAFLLHPVSGWISRTIHVQWRLAVNLVYLVVLVILIGIITLSGLAIVQQAQSLISSIERFIQTLPELVSDLSSRSFGIGPFRFDFSQLDLQSVTNQLLAIVQPMLGQAGTLLGRFAASAATTFSWLLFILIISYFLLSEAGHLRENLLHIEIPGYHSDVQILVKKLGATWDAFLRGQLVISLMVIVTYYLMLTILGTRLSIVIALMAGLARFVPYIGPAVTWTVTAIVVFLQGGNYLGLEPFAYTVLVVACCMLLDLVYDNMVVPRILGQSLGLHPAGVLVAALVLARLIGLIGVVLAAPVLATLLLVGRYVGRKMFDLPPWPPELEKPIQPPEMPWVRIIRRAEKVSATLRQRKTK